MTRIIALLTDFGLKDAYVGVLKGVISQINPHTPIIDITHHIQPQNLFNASFCLVSAFPYFPDNTIYLAIVDPGVGSQRKTICLRCPNGSYLVGPDNGIFTGVLNQIEGIEAIELSNQNYWRNREPSGTFHGRDIFAPVGAHLASGADFTKLGQPIPLGSLVKLPLVPYQLTSSGVVGVIQYIDHFGNLISNIPATLVEGKSWLVEVGKIIIESQSTYSDQNQGELLALISSDGWVEIAVNSGSAAKTLKFNLGDSILVKISNQK
jgi:S-adenosylmethionine hydrolase